MRSIRCQTHFSAYIPDLANATTPLEVLNNFVRFVEIRGDDVTVFFMFDDLPDDFTPDKKKAEHPCYQRCSTNSLVVEMMGFEPTTPTLRT